MNYPHHVATLRALAVTPSRIYMSDGSIQTRPHCLNRAGRRALAKAFAKARRAT